MDTILDPDKVRRYLDAFLPACIESAIAQFEAGADAIMWADHTTGDLCSPETYRDFLLEMHQHITQAIGGPSVFHCCGKTIDRVHLFANAGWDCFWPGARRVRAADDEEGAPPGHRRGGTRLVGAPSRGRPVRHPPRGQGPSGRGCLRRSGAGRDRTEDRGEARGWSI
jgi:hypothetical protein